MGGWKGCPHSVYVVTWDDARILKVGYSAKQRWRHFAIRGARVLTVQPFPDIDTALAMEHELFTLACQVGPAAFANRHEAVSFLGVGGAGWRECRRIAPEDAGALLRVMLERCSNALPDRAGDAIHERTNGRTYGEITHQPAHLASRNAHAHIPGFDVVEVKR